MQCSSLTSCSTFAPNYWAPAKCANCYKPEAAHTSSEGPGGPLRRSFKQRTALLGKGLDKRRNLPPSSPISSTAQQQQVLPDPLVWPSRSSSAP
jgi:hypothetical protein